MSERISGFRGEFLWELECFGKPDRKAGTFSEVKKEKLAARF